MRAPEDLHHLLRGVGAGGVPLPAEDLALGGEAQLGGQVVLGLGGGGVDLVLLGLAVTKKRRRGFMIQFFYYIDYVLIYGTTIKKLDNCTE